MSRQDTSVWALSPGMSLSTCPLPFPKAAVQRCLWSVQPWSSRWGQHSYVTEKAWTLPSLVIPHPPKNPDWSHLCFLPSYLKKIKVPLSASHTLIPPLSSFSVYHQSSPLTSVSSIVQCDPLFGSLVLPGSLLEMQNLRSVPRPRHQHLCF
jgi:hypothetical protein